MASRTETDIHAAVTAIRLDPKTLALRRPSLGNLKKTLVSPAKPAAHVNVDPAPLAEQGSSARYTMKQMLGEGGMGEVWVCRDERIGRDVAMKSIRAEHASDPEVLARFEREARVQGQLEHPSVVPVYDLGIGPTGTPFFTMKQVRGLTLEQIIEGLRSGNPEMTTSYSMRKLLTAFGSACLAVAFAHARGVLHRDLKPGNIMLGAYGEVHILDWGLSRIWDAPNEEGHDSVRDDNPACMTAVGQIVGTPGYMAPEQIWGDVPAYGPHTDVYALGAILFELLTLQPLHAQTNVQAILTSTLKGADARPSIRAPHRQVPPELEAICVRATIPSPDQRLPSAMDLHAAIERYLDGDRDIERRRALAEQHAAEAEAAADRAAKESGTTGKRSREQALRESMSALSLDPEHAGALRTLIRLLLDAPSELPPEARKEFAESRQPITKMARKTTCYAYALWLVIMLLVTPLGLVGYLHFVNVGLLAVAVLATYLFTRREFGTNVRFAVHVLVCVVIASMSLWMGPFILVPAIAAVHALGYVIYGEQKLVKYAIAANLLAVCAPPILQAIGWLPPSYIFHDGVMTVVPRVTQLPPIATPIYLLLLNIGLVVGPPLVIGRVRAKMSELEERLFLHVWNLRHLVPDAARAAAVPTSSKT